MKLFFDFHYPIINFEVVSACLPACVRVPHLCVYHIAGGPSSVDGVARPVQFHLTRGKIRTRVYVDVIDTRREAPVERVA